MMEPIFWQRSWVSSTRLLLRFSLRLPSILEKVPFKPENLSTANAWAVATLKIIWTAIRLQPCVLLWLEAQAAVWAKLLVSLQARFALRLELVIRYPHARVFLGSSILLAEHLLVSRSMPIALNFSVSLCHVMALIQRPLQETTVP